ncbi:hypothetical protein FDP41_002153 [Naegleria fowleri]|uniref:Small ribosomal subunit protein uS3 n=1 Tax=Naegleria fowleri TaxID=5763 RepID=A0A6A5BM24_NAEFO|nr:uncharacterized protein FDP41_002153 [Naegleria fowleri]KAF0979083.1 hypothetical protein FDP41_002153 [Naegleria fowleri]CAG4716887.1 unnamed protein product [Naegleria fowleri]
MVATQVNKKKHFVHQGILYAELNEFLKRELAEDGYSGVEVKATAARTEVVIRATSPQRVVGDNARRLKELTSVIQKRFGFEEGKIELYADSVKNKGLSAIAQAEELKKKLAEGTAVRKACYGILRFIMDSGAKGGAVIVSGKLRAQRAKSMKFAEGYMIRTGQPVKDYVDIAVRHVYMKQGVLGIKVKIMLPWVVGTGPQNQKAQPDVVTVQEPKEDLTVQGVIHD